MAYKNNYILGGKMYFCIMIPTDIIMNYCFDIRIFRRPHLVAMKWLEILFLLLCPFVCHAQCNGYSTRGTDFWLIYLANYVGEPEYSLIATCNRACTIHISNPITQWDTTVHTTTAGSVHIVIPVDTIIAYSFTEEVMGNSFHVTSNHPIALYASNFLPDSYDIATIYPTSALSTRYIVQNYNEGYGWGYCSEVGIVAIENNTNLYMALPNGSSRRITLMRGQSYRMGGDDFSGMEVTSTNGKPFALFQGTHCTNVGGCRSCDHLYEQGFPVDHWGNHFMLVSTAARSSGDLVQITALQGCLLSLNGTPLTSLFRGSSYYYHLPADSAVFLSSNNPVSVSLYLKGDGCDENELGDPSAVLIPPVEQGVSAAIFDVVNKGGITTEHFVNIVTTNTAVPYMNLDGASIDTAFTTTSHGYAYARLPVSPGIHALNCDSGKFVAWCYGLGIVESYAYIAGTSLLNIPEQLYVDGLNTATYMGSFDYCQGDTVSIWVERDEENITPVWFIDSVQTDIDTTYFHYLFDMGDHLVQAVVHPCDTLSAIIHIHPPISHITVTDTVCFEPYSWRGHTFDSTGTYYDTLPSIYGCDTLVTLNLTVVPRPEVAIISDIDCREATYTLVANLNGLPFSWSSEPHDTLLDGHEHDTLIIIKPNVPTLYSLDVDYICPINDTITLMPIEKLDTAWKIKPDILTYEHPWLDAYDLSHNVTSRQWIVNHVVQSETGNYLCYYASLDDDSVEVVLVISSNSCIDTLHRTIPFSHADLWVPNVFTPDAESNNRFSVTLNNGIAEELYIYTRQGMLVSHIEGPSPEWDGVHNGAACPQGTYVWLLHFHYNDHPNSRMTLSGTITLLR